MNFELFDYQARAATDIIDAIDEGAARFEKNHRLTAVSLAAPTAAGKTVIATAVIEALLHGGLGRQPRPDTTVLWITDDPSLNLQTEAKMLVASSDINPSQIVTIDESIDQRALDPGKVYFINIQKLGRKTSYVQTGNKRQHSLWTTIATTIAERGSDFVLFIDEAHRGTTSTSGRQSIVSRLLNGADGKQPPSPIAVAITATPDRFVTAIKGSGRTHHPVVVKPEEVAASGLIKDKVGLRHPTETQPADSTLIELAAQALRDYTNAWAQYSEDENEPEIRPALVIQVPAKVSDDELLAILDTLRSKWPALDGKAIGHCFQDHTTLDLGARTVRYIAPHLIQDDPLLRVVLFKEALTTGWDCPRAEVMVSLRTAKDYTYIAQLIGRMVRTPLARRIATNTVLNTVALYLPFFDADNTSKVIDYLKGDDDGGLTADIEIQPVECARNDSIDEAVWDLLNSIPSFTRPGKYHRNEIARLNSFAQLLDAHGLESDARRKARTLIIDTLRAQAKALGEDLDEMIADYEKIDYDEIVYDTTTGERETVHHKVDVNIRNIADLYERACRTLGDSAGRDYWNNLIDPVSVGGEGLDPEDAKIKVAAVTSFPTVVTNLWDAARGLIGTWRNTHNGAINQLEEEKRAKFHRIWSQGREPERITLIMPTVISAATQRIINKDGNTTTVDLPRFKEHLYVHKGTFPAKLNSWEQDVLAAELSKDSLIGWYRNPTGGENALAVPYGQSENPRTLYPDFLFVHDTGDGPVIDIIDPHRPSEADTSSKWLGLAQFAQDPEHKGRFRRVLAVIKNKDGQLLSLDLTNGELPGKLRDASTEDGIRKLFDTYGGSY